MDIELLLSHPKQLRATRKVARNPFECHSGEEIHRSSRNHRDLGYFNVEGFAGLDTLAVAVVKSLSDGIKPPGDESVDGADTSSIVSFTSVSSSTDAKPDSEVSSIKAKRKRASAHQVDVLRQTFTHNPFPSSDTRRKLADQLGMTPRSVQIWFQNQRQLAKNISLTNAPDLQP